MDFERGIWRSGWGVEWGPWTCLVYHHHAARLRDATGTCLPCQINKPRCTEHHTTGNNRRLASTSVEEREAAMSKIEEDGQWMFVRKWEFQELWSGRPAVFLCLVCGRHERVLFSRTPPPNQPSAWSWLPAFNAFRGCIRARFSAQTKFRALQIFVPSPRSIHPLPLPTFRPSAFLPSYQSQPSTSAFGSSFVVSCAGKGKEKGKERKEGRVKRGANYEDHVCMLTFYASFVHNNNNNINTIITMPHLPHQYCHFRICFPPSQLTRPKIIAAGGSKIGDRGFFSTLLPVGELGSG